MLQLAGEEAVLARDHGRGRQADGDLLGDVRAGEHGDRAAVRRVVESRSPVAGSSPFVRLSTGASPGRRGDDVGEGAARNRDDDHVDVAGRLGDGSAVDAAQVDARS